MLLMHISTKTILDINTNVHVYILHVFSSTQAQTKVELELYLCQSVVDYMCVSNMSMNIYYYSELGHSMFN